MDDERLLAEALRAHAAGGVSAPGPSTGAGRAATPATPATTTGSGRGGGDATTSPGGSSGLRDRFRPLARSGREARSGDAGVEGRPAPPPAPPTAPVRGAMTGRPGAGPPPNGPRPARPPLGPGPAGGVPQPRRAPGPGGNAGPGTPARPQGPALAPPPPPDAERGTETGWTTARIAWWSGIALLSGAVAGALAAVGTLVLPG